MNGLEPGEYIKIIGALGSALFGLALFVAKMRLSEIRKLKKDVNAAHVSLRALRAENLQLKANEHFLLTKIKTIKVAAEKKGFKLIDLDWNLPE